MLPPLRAPYGLPLRVPYAIPGTDLPHPTPRRWSAARPWPMSRSQPASLFARGAPIYGDIDLVVAVTLVLLMAARVTFVVTLVVTLTLFVVAKKGGGQKKGS